MESGLTVLVANGGALGAVHVGGGDEGEVAQLEDARHQPEHLQQQQHVIRGGGGGGETEKLAKII